MPFLDRFDALVLDLNGTLAEGFDRFGPDQDYGETYRSLGHGSLDPEALREVVDSVMDRLLARYEAGPADPFPSLGDFLQGSDLSPGERERISALVAIHEMGTIPQQRMEFVRRLALSHRLALVSDLWAPADTYRDYLHRTGVDRHFQSMIFSCEHGAVKPSQRLFFQALSELAVPAGRAVFIGDHESRDILGAAACGMATVWIDRAGAGPDVSRPDRVIRSLEELASLD